MKHRRSVEFVVLVAGIVCSGFEDRCLHAAEMSAEAGAADVCRGDG